MSAVVRSRTWFVLHRSLHAVVEAHLAVVEGMRRALVSFRHLVREYKPVLLVILSLLYLLVLRLYVQGSVGALVTDLTQVVEPATRAAADMQLALSREAASTRAFVIERKAEYMTAFAAARAARRDAQSRLAALLPRLRPSEGRPELLEDVAATLPLADQSLDALYRGTLTRAGYLRGVPVQHARFLRVTTGVSGVQQALRKAATTREDKIASVQRLGTILALVGGALGLLASVSVGQLIASQRVLATRERLARAAAEKAHADAELRRAQLERVTAERGALIRGFSHDVRTPLNTADGFLYVVEREAASALAPGHARAVAKARRSLSTAVGLIDDLLSFATKETGAVEVHRVGVDLTALVESLVEDYRGAAALRGLVLAANSYGERVRVHSDPARVRQILTNLISNAIKYTDDGGISVAAGVRRGKDGRRSAVVDISDTGLGIAREDHERVFEEFERREGTRAAGAGIGLTISRRLARLLGGDITLESEPGRGSTFTLWLPPESRGAAGPSLIYNSGLKDQDRLAVV